MRRFLALAAVIGCVSAVDLSTLQKVFNYQVQADSSIQGGAVAVFDTTGFNSLISGSFGYADRVNGIPMMLDSGVRMNTLAEQLIVAAALKLVSASILSLDSAIPSAYLPRQVPLVNPAFPSTTITLRMLMTHTSTLSDASFETSSRTSPSAVVDLQTFVVGYCITTSGGVNVLSSSLFTSTAQPGTAAAYSYAKINSALLTFVVELAVLANPKLVTSTTYTALEYVREAVLGPLGMSDTFTLTLDGGFPTLSYPSGGPVYTNTLVADLSSAGTAISTKTLHPAYFSDYMTMSTALDMASFVRALFLVSTSASTTGSLATAGTLMKQTKQTVTSATTAVTATGLGVLFFNGATMCASALATSAVTVCPLSATNNIWGFVSSEAFSQVGYYCTDWASTTNPTCVVTVHTFNDAGTTFKDASISQAMAAAALQLATGDTTVVSQSTVSTSATSNLYGVWVFFGVLGVLVFVLAASYFTEYIIQPAPVIGGVPVPQSMMPQQVPRLPTDTVFNRN